jgi:hypothetical protein
VYTVKPGIGLPPPIDDSLRNFRLIYFRNRMSEKKRRVFEEQILKMYES